MAIRLVLVVLAAVMLAGSCTRALPDVTDGIAVVADDATDDAIAPETLVVIARYERVSRVVADDPPVAVGRVHVASTFRPPRASSAR